MKTILELDRIDLIKLYKGVGVEIGVANGRYSRRIMERGKVTKLYGIDPYVRHRGYMDYTRDKTFSDMRTNAHALLDKYPNYEFIETYSMEAVKQFKDESLDFVYIDGDHSYKAVTDDMTAWIKKLKPGGVMAGDDYIRSARDKRYYDVIRAVDDFVEKNNIPELFLYHGGRTPTNWMFRKP